MPTDRISKRDYFLHLAEDVSLRSTCLHRHVGALLVKDGRILATGYNGAASGQPHCLDVGCSKPIHAKNFEDCKAIHAEMNCLLYAAKHGVSVDGSVLYCTTEPCKMCRNHLAAIGITEYIYSKKYE